MLELPLSAVSGDENKTFLSRLYELYGAAVLNTANQILNDRQQAEDVLQDTFVKIIPLLERLRELDPDERKGYLIQTAKHVSYDKLRKIKKEKKAAEKQLEASEAYASDSAGGYDADTLYKAVAQLDERERYVIYARFEAELTYEAVAAQLGVSEGNARQIMSRALKKLRELMKGE
ncbi:MAG: sigma-70 family RNA polymerase sigma factor [Clostridia bacterium]|nr:sigma-70 family RNA polymerase sigma factor [Clostridia bacterium]